MQGITDTRQGRVQGIVHADHTEYRGIPYAGAPIGEFRFAAPPPPKSWTGIRRADRFGDAGLQTLSPLHGINRSSEDCLTLNIWTPPPQTAPRPVMVWIHGGGFCSGSGSQLMYRGKDLALAGDMIVVTINYRLGVAGFLHLDQVMGDATGIVSNPGLRDIIAALEWVRDNIGFFGGDPTQVTLFGESAGAMCIASLLGMPSARGLFRRAIVQSGGADFVLTREEADRVAHHFLRYLGLGAGDAGKLAQLDAATLLKAQNECLKLHYNRGQYQQSVIQHGMTLVPVIDGELLPQAPIRMLQDGSASDIPLLVSCTRDEWNLFLHAPEGDGISPAQRHFSDFSKSRLIDLCEKRMPGLGERAANLYEEQTPRWLKNPSALDMFSAFESDRMFRIPSLRIAEAQAAQGGPVYMAHFDFDEGPMGACHGIDLPLVFGHTDTALGKILTGGSEQARRLGRQVQNAWIGFARSGNPGTDGIGAWQPWRHDEHHTMHFRKEAHPGRDPARHVRSLWEGVL